MDALPVLAVDKTGPTWRLVVRYCEQRIALLSGICTSLASSDDERRMACARIAELRDLVGAPDEAKRMAMLANHDERGVY